MKYDPRPSSTPPNLRGGGRTGYTLSGDFKDLPDENLPPIPPKTESQVLDPKSPPSGGSPKPNESAESLAYSHETSEAQSEQSPPTDRAAIASMSLPGGYPRSDEAVDDQILLPSHIDEPPAIDRQQGLEQGSKGSEQGGRTSPILSHAELLSEMQRRDQFDEEYNQAMLNARSWQQQQPHFYNQGMHEYPGHQHPATRPFRDMYSHEGQRYPVAAPTQPVPVQMPSTPDAAQMNPIDQPSTPPPAGVMGSFPTQFSAQYSPPFTPYSPMQFMPNEAKSANAATGREPYEQSPQSPSHFYLPQFNSPRPYTQRSPTPPYATYPPSPYTPTPYYDFAGYPPGIPPSPSYSGYGSEYDPYSSTGYHRPLSPYEAPPGYYSQYSRPDNPGPPIQTAPGPLNLMGPPGANLFVFHIPSTFSNTDMYTLFSPYGALKSVRIMTESGTGRGRGFGFVSFENTESAAIAIANLNGIAIAGKRLKVQLKQEGKSWRQREDSKKEWEQAEQAQRERIAMEKLAGSHPSSTSGRYGDDLYSPVGPPVGMEGDSETDDEEKRYESIVKALKEAHMSSKKGGPKKDDDEAHSKSF